MRIAVITCERYKDAWHPFKELFDHFWPDCPYFVTFYSDDYRDPWCKVVRRCANEADGPVLMLMEDYFLNAPVDQEMVEYGLDQMKIMDAGCVRLYPCPGPDEDYGDPYFGIVSHEAPHRISTMAAIWDPRYLAEIAELSSWTTGEAGDFENLGTPASRALPQPILSFKREIEPWPLSYLCSAISRGKWEPAAKELCDSLNIINVDWSKRPFA